MIKANELRCDNIILYNNQYHYVSLIDSEIGEAGIYPCFIPNGLIASLKMIPIDHLNPILITEEILRDRLGLKFKQYGRSENTKHISFWEYGYDDLLTIEFDPIHGVGITLFEDGFNIHHNRIILYVNQFQNIIYELTGKELKINFQK